MAMVLLVTVAAIAISTSFAAEGRIAGLCPLVLLVLTERVSLVVGCFVGSGCLAVAFAASGRSSVAATSVVTAFASVGSRAAGSFGSVAVVVAFAASGCRSSFNSPEIHFHFGINYSNSHRHDSHISAS